MNKLRRNNFNSRLTVENMSESTCYSYCSDFCFMIACICDNLNPTQNEDTYETNHDNGSKEGRRELIRVYG